MGFLTALEAMQMTARLDRGHSGRRGQNWKLPGLLISVLQAWSLCQCVMLIHCHAPDEKPPTPSRRPCQSSGSPLCPRNATTDFVLTMTRSLRSRSSSEAPEQSLKQYRRGDPFETLQRNGAHGKSARRSWSLLATVRHRYEERERHVRYGSFVWSVWHVRRL